MKVNVNFSRVPEAAHALRRIGALLSIYATAAVLGILLEALTHAP